MWNFEVDVDEVDEVETPRNELKQVVILCVGEIDRVVACSQQRQMQSTKQNMLLF